MGTRLEEDEAQRSAAADEEQGRPAALRVDPDRAGRRLRPGPESGRVDLPFHGRRLPVPEEDARLALPRPLAAAPAVLRLLPALVARAPLLGPPAPVRRARAAVP